MTLDEATRLLAEAGVENPRADARLLLAHVLGISRDQSLTAVPTPQQAAQFAALVPRPDTETLIEEALRLVPDRAAPLRIADLGTGSGAILIAALKEFPNATGI